MSRKIKSTKQLACDLGLIRKRNFSVPQQDGKKRRKADVQLFTHLIVMDFESTCWENERNTPQEIIEFPAVLINCCSGEIESEFHYYIQPSENPSLSEFCQQLTGISQDLVDDGIPLSQCLRKFLLWLKKLQKEKGIVCGDDKNFCVSKNSPIQNNLRIAAFVTWSDWDLGVCLLYETKRKQIMKPSVLDRWIDLRATYRKFYSRRPDGLSGALKDLGINFDGRQHSGLDDARNTAKLAYRMMCDGCVLSITKTLKMGLLPSHEQNLFSHQNSTCSASTNSVQPNLKLESKKDKAHTDNIRCMIDLTRSSDETCSRVQAKLSVRNPNLPLSSKSTENSFTSVHSHKNFCSLATVGNTSISAPTLKSASSSKQSSVKHKKIHPDDCNKAEESIIPQRQNMSSSFSTNKPSSSRLSMTLDNQSLRSGIPTAFTMPFKTPPGEPKPLMRVTPPLCSCGRRSKRRCVQNPGPNIGRWFYSCPINNSSSGGKCKGCTFFRWESPPSGNRLPR